MKTHLQPVGAVVPVVHGECEWVAAPFAIPILPGTACAEFLDSTGGVLPDTASIARVLHHQAELGTESQGLYLFPRVIDAATLVRLLEPQARATITEAMVADVIETAGGEASKLAPLIPAPDFTSAPLMFMLGAVFADQLSPHPLHLSRPSWWQKSAVRQECESMFCGQFAERGIPTPLSPMPAGASELHDALQFGVVELLSGGTGGIPGELQVHLQDAATVSLDVGSTRVVLPLRELGEVFVEDIINAVALRSRYRARHPLH